MPSNAREHHTPAAVKPGRRAKNGSPTANSLRAIGGLIKNAGTPSKVQANLTDGSEKDVGKVKTSPQKAEDTATPAEVKVSNPSPSDEVGVSVPSVDTTKSGRKSGKSLAAGRALEASSVELANFGNCLICSNPVGLTARGLWVIPEKNEKGRDIMTSRYTCSAACEKIQDAKPRYLGTVIKTRMVTSFAPYSDSSDS